MDLQNAWAVAAKDFKIYRRKTNVIYASVALPFIIGVVFPFIMDYSLTKKTRELSVTLAPQLMNAFSIWFLIAAGIIPTAIASYSLVGEKIQKSLEPLLATPMTDGEILLGKVISGLLIPVLAIYTGSLIFMVLMDYFTRGILGYLYYPNWSFGMILLLVPLASLMSVEISVIISSRLNDVRSAQQLGSLMLLPFAGLYLASELGFFTFNEVNLLILGGAIFAVSIGLFFVSKATFQREEILTKWR